MTYINKMTLRRFKEILGRVSGWPSIQSTGTLPFRTLLYREVPLRRWLAPLAKLPGAKEHFVRMAVCVLERT